MPPPDRSRKRLDELAQRAQARPAVVLDDDPTGTQTLRDVFVLTSWDADAIARHLDDPVLFLSTNSRALDAAAAERVAVAAVEAAVRAAAGASRPLSVISRSDSTLRGHFPVETAAIARAMGAPDARILLAPYFGDGGRVTVDDVHFLERDGVRIPVADTEFARDRAFGYRSSNLREWAAEKHVAAGLPVPATTSLGLGLLRAGGPRAVADALRAMPPGAVAIANAETDEDIEIVALGALIAEEAGLPLVARTAASYVRARAGRRRTETLRAADLAAFGPGLVVVGSHVETTTRQVERLAQGQGDRLAIVELSVERLLEGSEAAILEATRTVGTALAGGRSGAVVTERVRRDVGLPAARAISTALAEVVRRLDRRPGWVIAKGGITSHDVAAAGMGMREARVAGQLLPGVPVWIGTGEARWPGVPLVVFPGNVGGADALAEAVALLSG